MAILKCASDNTRFLLVTSAPYNSWWRMHSQHSYPTLFPLPGCNLKAFRFSWTPTSIRSAWWRKRVLVMMAFCNTHLANTSQCPPLEQRSVLNKWGHLCELFLSLPHSKIRIEKKINQLCGLLILQSHLKYSFLPVCQLRSISALCEKKRIWTGYTLILNKSSPASSVGRAWDS